MINREIKISVEARVSKYEDLIISDHVSVKGRKLSRYPNPIFIVTDDPTTILNRLSQTPMINNGSAGIFFGSLDLSETDLITINEIKKAGM